MQKPSVYIVNRLYNSTKYAKNNNTIINSIKKNKIFKNKSQKSKISVYSKPLSIAERN